MMYEKDFEAKLIDNTISDQLDYTFVENIIAINRSINDELADNVKDDYIPDVDVGDELTHLVKGYSAIVADYVYSDCIEIMKDLNTMDDEQFIEKMTENPALYLYRINPSKTVKDVKKLLEL